MFEELFVGQALWFSIPALLGTGVFILRILFMLIGGDGGDGVDMDTDAGGSLDGDDSSGAFAILSVQGVSAFLMGFGWVGIGCFLGASWSAGMSLGVGTLGGIVLVWIMANILGAVRGLESSGNIDIQSALGKTGEVYAQVPENGTGKGKVKLVISNHQRIYNAISEGPAFASGTRVRVVAVNDDNSLSVGSA